MPSYSVTVDCTDSDFEILLAELEGYEIAGVEQAPDGATVHFAERPEAERFAARHAAFRPTLVEIAARNWAEEWQAQWQPSPVGKRFYLAPPWDASATPAGRIRLEMRPGLVFGGGDHPTTQLCLQLLEDWLPPRASVADIGCGSGILSDAACALGASAVAACDIAFDAALAARDVLTRPGHAPLAFCGSADAIRSAWARVVAANLLTGVVVSLAPEFARILAPGGLLIASGFLEEQKDAVHGRIGQWGFQLREERDLGDWAAGVYERLPPA